MPTGQSTDRLIPDRDKAVVWQTLNTLEFLAGGRRAMGTITFSGQPSDAEVIVIGDGVNTATTFEFDDDSSVTAGNVAVTIGATAEATLDALLALINSTGDGTVAARTDTFRITGEKSGTTIINLKNDEIGTVGNVTITETATNVAVTGMTLGTDIGQVDTEMQAEVIVSPGDIEIGSVNLLSQADDQIDPSAAYAEDTGAAAGHWVTPAGAVRTDTRASLVSATADHSAMQLTANGDLRTRDDDLLTEVGAIADAAVEGDTAGSVHAQLRGANTNAGAVADAAVAADAAGSMSAKLRGINNRLGTTGDAADVDGNQAAQLRYIGENIGSIEETIQECDDNTEFTALNDAANLADQTNHVTGDAAVEWDKTGGTHVNSGIQDTITVLDLNHFGAADYVMMNINIPDLTDVANVLLRLGTDDANYTEWIWADTEIVAAVWNTLVKPIGEINGVTGTGWQQGSVTYVAVAVVFDAAGDTLNNMIVDRVSVVTSEAVTSQAGLYTEDTPHTTGDEGNMPLIVRTDTRASRAGTDGDYTPIQATANGDARVRDDDLLTEVGALADAAVSGDTAGSVHAKLRGMQKRLGTNGDASDVDGTQAGQLRAAAQALEIIDDWDESDRAKVNPIAGQAGIAANAGVMDALTTRVTIATDDTHMGAVAAASDVDGVVHGQLRYIGEAVENLKTDFGTVGEAADVDGAVHGQLRYIGDFLATAYGAVGAAADPDGVIHGQLRSIAENTDTLETLLAFGTGAMAASQSVTLATDDTQLGSIGAAADVDGNVHGQLRYIGENYETHMGTVGAAADVDGVVHAQLRYIGDTLAGGLTVDITGDHEDLDSGAGTDDHEVFALGVAAAGGHEIMTGTAANGLDVDVTRLPYGTGAMAASVAVTVATDDTQYGAVGAAADVDGNVHGQLRYIGEQFDTAFGAVGAAADVDGVVHGQLRSIAEAVEIVDDWDTTIADGQNIHGHDAGVVCAQIFGRSAAATVGEVEASAMAGAADNLDGNTGLNTASVLFARIDDANVEHVHMIDAIHSLKVDTSSVAGTATNVNGGNRDAGTQTVTLADNDPGITSLALIDDAIHADDDIYTALDKGVFCLAVRNDNLGTTYATADQSYNPIATTEKGAVHVAVGDGVATAEVVTDAALTTDIDGGAGLHTVASMYARQDNDTVEPVVANASGQLEVEVATAAAVTRVESNPVAFEQFVAVAGTREAFAGSQQVIYFLIRAGKAAGVNTGNVYIGTAAVDQTTAQQIILSPGDTYEFKAPDGLSTDLDAWFVDADNAADGITGFYLA